MTDDSSIVSDLDRILEQVQEFDRTLIGGLEEAWRDLTSIIESQTKSLDSTPVPPVARWDLNLFRAARQDLSTRLFSEPEVLWDRRRPYKRALSVVENYETGLADLVRSAPESAVAGSDVREFLRKHAVAGLRFRLAMFRVGRELPVRALLEMAFARRVEAWSPIEGRFLWAMAQSLRMLRTGWEVRRTELDATVEGTADPTPEIELLQRELGFAQELRKTVENAFDAMRTWSAATSGLVAADVLAGPRKSRPGALSKSRTRRDGQRNHRIRQLRSTETEIKLEQGLLQVESRTFALASETIGNLHDERLALIQELDETTQWCRAVGSPANQQPIPAPIAGFVPVSSRLRDFEQSFRVALERLPESLEVLTRLLEAPPRRIRSRWLAPRSTFNEAYRRRGHPLFLAALEEVDGEHRRIVREIERAREVVAFGKETAAGEHDAGIEQESVKNALLLLEYAREQCRDWGPSVSAKIARALASVFAENRLLLRQKRLGALLYVSHQGFRRAVPAMARAAVTGLRRAGGFTYDALLRATNRLLVAIGWRATPESTEPDITTRPFLPAEFTIDLTTKELPAIYRRLFRFAPVEDPRFLVGREEEIRALSEARELWEKGRPASIIIVGRRGSGKTSLINCAIKRSLEGIEVIRGEIKRRVVTEQELRAVIADLAGVDDPARLEEFLTEKPRVFVLEELERTFLRQVGHYGAIRSLQRLIASTCSRTLWVVAVNQVAFRFMDAATGLGQSFSHRINATTVSRDNLRLAILLRHNLSGLRLGFAPLPATEGLIERLKLRIHSDQDPETVFFKLLTRESAGIFRSAFEMWLGQIDRAEAGTLYMKPMLDADLSGIVADLELRDLFTLVAILQHGSLTPEEHGKVFQVSQVVSRAQIDELVAREIVEPDPGREGLRIRPEAMRIVHQTLYRRNLL